MDRERVKNVVKQMTLEEKVSLTEVDESLSCRGLSRLKVPPFKLPEELFPFSEVCVFSRLPGFFALAHTFDRQLATAFGRLRSRRALTDGISYGGVVPLGVIRRPFAAPAGDCFSDEPALCAEMAAAYAAGCELKPLGVNLLGPACYDRRMGERALNEIYLSPFYRTASLIGGVVLPGGLLNGVPAAENRAFMKKLTAVTDGAIVTGPGAAVDKAEEVSSGHCLDVMCTAGDSARLHSAVKNGLLFERKLDVAVERNVMAAAECYAAVKGAKNISISPNQEDGLIRRAAEESAVLLKNAGALPLRPSDRVVCYGTLVLEGALNVCVDFARDLPKKTDKLALCARGADKAVVVVENADLVDGAALKNFVSALKKFAAPVVIAHGQRYFPLPYLSECDGLVFLPYFGAGSAEALHALLMGESDFTGRLACSWAASAADYPADAYGIFAGRDCYLGESVYVGSRYFSVFKSRLLFPLGYGKSYRQVDFGAFKASEKDGRINFSFDAVSRDGLPAETVVIVSGGLATDAVYGVGDRLMTFERISLTGGPPQRVNLSCPVSRTDVYDAASGCFLACGGRYDFRIGCAADVRMNASCKLGKKFTLRGMGADDVPTYFPSSGKFAPSPRDMEREVGVPPGIGEKKFSPSEVRAADKAVKRIYLTRAIKRDSRSLRRFNQALAALPPPVKSKIVKSRSRRK